MSALAESVQGDIPRALAALRGLSEMTTSVELRDGYTWICGGALCARDRTVISEIGADAWDEYRIAVSSLRAVTVQWATKQPLWKLVLDCNGPEFAQGHVWQQFNLRPKDPFWQKTLASYMGSAARYHNLAATGHAFIDYSLSIISKCIDALPTAKQKQVWDILTLPMWHFHQIPDIWGEVERGLGSKKHVFQTRKSVSSVTGALAVKGINCEHCTYHGYAPNERNRIALIALFIYRARPTGLQHDDTVDSSMSEDDVDGPHGHASRAHTSSEADMREEKRDMSESLKWSRVPDMLWKLAVALSLARSKEELEERRWARTLRAQQRARDKKAEADRRFWGGVREAVPTTRARTPPPVDEEEDTCYD